MIEIVIFLVAFAAYPVIAGVAFATRERSLDRMDAAILAAVWPSWFPARIGVWLVRRTGRGLP